MTLPLLFGGDIYYNNIYKIYPHSSKLLSIIPSTWMLQRFSVNTPADESNQTPDPLSLFVDGLSLGKTNHTKKCAPERDKHCNDCYSQQLTTTELTEKAPSYLKVCTKHKCSKLKNVNEPTMLNKIKHNLNCACTFEYMNLRRLCNEAAKHGQIDTVKKLRKAAYSCHPELYKKAFSLKHLVVEAEFHAGHPLQALDRLADLFKLTQLPPEPCVGATASQAVLTRKLYHRKLTDTTVFLLWRIPNIDNTALWDKVRSILFVFLIINADSVWIA